MNSVESKKDVIVLRENHQKSINIACMAGQPWVSPPTLTFSSSMSTAMG